MAGGSMQTARGDGAIIPHPGIHIISYPEIEYHNVTVTIEDQYATTFVDQSFYNPYDVTMEGTYVFPVPQGAVISQFELIIDGEVHETQIMDEEEAAAFFREAVAAHQDASLLEYVDRDLFSYTVSIPSQESRQICLRYEELLSPHGGLYRYAYTLGTEKYSSALIDVVDVKISISSQQGIETVYSPTHPVRVERTDTNHVTVMYHVEDARPDRDLALYYTTTDEPFGAGFLRYEDGEEGYFLFLFSPNPDQFQERIIPKDIVFVIDESGSMSGTNIFQAKEALSFILEQLHPEDRFSIINFDSTIHHFSPTLRQATGENITDALDYVDSIQADGMTNIHDALLDGVDILASSMSEDSIKVIVFLTDGKPTQGITAEDAIVQDVSNANLMSEVDASIFVFGVGYNVNTHLLDRISSENHGHTVYVTPEESIELALTDFYGKISSPVLTNISVSFDGMLEYECYPQVLPDVFKGSQISLVGKYVPADHLQVSLQGTTGDGPREYTFPFSLTDAPQHEFIPRLWATRKIGSLLNQLRLQGEDEELIAEIRTLGLQYGIVTPYTSMLIKADRDSNQSVLENSDAFYSDSGSNGVLSSKWIVKFGGAESDTLATGVNIVTRGVRTFVNVEGTYIDLSLLTNVTSIELGAGTVEEWIAANLPITRTIPFGSDGYFALTSELSAVLSLGTKLVVAHEGEVLYITDHTLTVTKGTVEVTGSMVEITWETDKPTIGTLRYRLEGSEGWLEVEEPDLTTEHVLTISDLAPGVFEWYLRVQDDQGNLTTFPISGGVDKFVIDPQEPEPEDPPDPEPGEPCEILNVQLTTGPTVVVSWETSSLALGQIYYQSIGHDDWHGFSEIGSGWYRTQHEHILTLDPGEYRCYIECRDQENNLVVDDNHGSYYPFTITDQTPPSAKPALAVGNVQQEVNDGMVTISWDTTVPASAILSYRPVGGPIWISRSEPGYRTDHTYTLFLHNKEYEFKILCIDEAGAELHDDNSGMYYTFTMYETTASGSVRDDASFPITFLMVPLLITAVAALVLVGSWKSETEELASFKQQLELAAFDIPFFGVVMEQMNFRMCPDCGRKFLGLGDQTQCHWCGGENQ